MWRLSPSCVIKITIGLSSVSRRAISTQNTGVQEELQDELLYTGPSAVSGTGRSFDAVHDTKPSESGVEFVSTHENQMLEFQRYWAKRQQVGPYIGSQSGAENSAAIEKRSRREVERVPQYQPPYEHYQTTVVKLPPECKLPSEGVLRALFPMDSLMQFEKGETVIADENRSDPTQPPAPIPYQYYLPKNFDKTSDRRHPILVIIPDGSKEIHFGDVCFNFFERPGFIDGIEEFGWVLVCPRMDVSLNRDGAWKDEVIKRFCDFAVKEFKGENGMVHLFGVGRGADTLLQNIVRQPKIAVSVTCILGRQTYLFDPFKPPFEMVQNLNGTHLLLFVPHLLPKVHRVHEFKHMIVHAKVRPPPRIIMYSDIADKQTCYAISPQAFWNHLNYFRVHNYHLNGLMEYYPPKPDFDIH